ncbi:cryptochrome/photolyase family protein [Ferrimonas sediminicola]|uniref:Cryptochrome/photolyase family protein n=1 Tax=Ferrimonas sediminicola TaxID=2569538 RepID=A0A4U1BDE5_9GAMM|nr:cryptochrome/photolyase family protein [Ferrimonas sediminicola]TKB49052.1 cryptochrome/photolyase family protein [Ferrimonas sediminicola]
MTPTLRLILGDQLNPHHSWYDRVDQQCLYVVAELKQETGYVRHHLQKVAALFLAMEAFARHLAEQGHQVVHLPLDDTTRFADLPELLTHLCALHEVARLEYQLPDEYRLTRQLADLRLPGIEIRGVESEHFLLPRARLNQYFSADHPLKMETFYRRMRRELGILMDEGKPSGGRWNFDARNRHPISDDEARAVPQPCLFANDCRPVLARLRRHGIDTLGHCPEQLIWPVTRLQALQQLQHFCRHLLPRFGQFQDALTETGPHAWTLYHSRLSFALNTKMLHPMEVIRAAVAAHEYHPERVDLAQVEGFVRQILGWREFVRGIYWSRMPGYAKENALGARRPLPGWFWTGHTRMRCLARAIDQSLTHGYAHHIQRLMVTGTFCLLAGIDPDEVDQWYLGIYVDAFQWVELPNTRGMSQYADGGVLATKPYAASANYLNRMGNHCQRCPYDPKQKSGDHACPFNSLYWHFIHRHSDRFARHPRMGMIYRHWFGLAPKQQDAVLERARQCLASLEQL